MSFIKSMTLFYICLISFSTTPTQGLFMDLKRNMSFEELPVINKDKLKIMIIDTGVSPHVFLQAFANVTTSFESFDPVGHGTHVAGIAALGSLNGDKIDPLCRDVEIIACRGLSVTASEDVVIRNTIKCIKRATAEKIDIINYSGGGSSEIKEEFEAWKSFSNQGGIIVASAGNDSRDIQVHPYYPASWGVPNKFNKVKIQNLFAVANAEEDGSLNIKSNYYPNMILEQGTDIISTLPNNKFTDLTGTSMAAPQLTHKIAKKFCTLKHSPVVSN